MEKKEQERYINKAAKILSEVRRFVVSSDIELPKELKLFEGFRIDYIPSPFDVADAYGINYKYIKLIGDEPSYYNSNCKTIFISDKYRNDSYRAKFLCAHELAHYIFDFNENEKSYYYDTYSEKDADDRMEEKRANKFAANLLMPEEEFRKKFRDFQDLQSKADTVNALGQYFAVSSTAIIKRLCELGYNDYVEMKTQPWKKQKIFL